MSETDVIKGTIKIQNILEEACVLDFPDLIRQLPNFITIEVPSTISNVVIGPQQPGSDKRNNLWIRTDSSGDFLGIFVYAVGLWRQVYPVPMGLIRIADGAADSRTPPVGYTLATEANVLTQSQKDFLVQQWHWHLDVPNTYYDIFDVFFTGY